eukprot:UN24696
MEHWEEFKQEKVAEITKYCIRAGAHRLFKPHIIEQDLKGFYSDDLEQQKEKTYKWPKIPDGKDWRTRFLARVMQKQQPPVKRLILATALNSPSLLPAELEPLAIRTIE